MGLLGTQPSGVGRADTGGQYRSGPTRGTRDWMRYRG
jgi:hypothetical protein